MAQFAFNPAVASTVQPETGDMGKVFSTINQMQQMRLMQQRLANNDLKSTPASGNPDA